MRKFLFYLVVLCLSWSSYGQLLSEDFEGTTFPPSGWTLNQTNPNVTWYQLSGGVTGWNSGKTAAVDYDDVSNQDEWLITPSLDLTSATNPELSFSIGYSYYWAVSPEDNYDVHVKVSTDNGVSWTSIWDDTQEPSFTTPFMKINKLLDLTAFAGESNVKIAFQYIGFDGAGLYLDDVVVGEELPVNYCEPTAANANWEYITNVNFAGINNDTTGIAGLNDYTNQIAEVTVGDTETLSVTISPDGSDYLTVFIDWNQNGSFLDAGEAYVLATDTDDEGPFTEDIEIPADAVPGETRMRVMLRFSEAPEPCGSYTFGEIEDYTINITEGATEPGDETCFTLNHPILQTFDGSYFKWDTGQASDTTIAGYHFNPYASNSNLSFYFGSNGGSAVSSAATGTGWLVLEPGDIVGPNSVFSSGTGTATNWIGGVDGYLGISFPCDAGTCYGYAKLVTTGPTGFPATLVDYCFDPTGEAVVIPGNEEPSEPNCDQSVASNDLENGGLFGGANNQRLAVDIVAVPNSSFDLQQIKLNIAQAAAPTYFNIIIREDANGLPGNALHTLNDVEVDNTVMVGTNFGLTFYTYTFDVSAENISLDGGTTGARYWMEVASDAAGWESTFADTYDLRGAFFNNVSGQWRVDATEYVYELIGECTGEPACQEITEFPFTETFENDSFSRLCWSNEYVEWTAGWSYTAGAQGGVITTGNGGEGLNAKFVSNGDDEVTKLVSPVFNLDGYTEAKLTFSYAQEAWFGDQNELKVYYRVDASSAWVELAHYDSQVTSWTEVELDLPNPSATYQIAFEGIDNWGHASVVDDVTISVESEEEPEEGCLDAPYGQYPSNIVTPSCSGTIENITGAAWTGEFSLVQVTAGVEYIFSSSITTDFVTIADENGTVVYAAGTESVTWTATADEVIRVYLHLDEECNAINSGTRAKRVLCGEVPPAPENDECDGAIALSCGDTMTGSTLGANDSGGNTSNDVFFTFTGNGTEELVTISLCGSDYDTVVAVYSDCTLTNQIAMNDDSGNCPMFQSEVSFISDGTSTYVILVEGYSGFFGDEAGDFELTVTCGEVPEQPGEPDFPCFFGDGLTSSFDNAYNIEMSNDFRSADDFIVEEGTQFTMQHITIDTNQQSVPDNVVIYIREDNGGSPGAVIETINTVPTSATAYAEAFSDPIYHMTFDLATPIVLTEGTYWLDTKMSAPTGEVVWWLATSTGSHGSVAYQSTNNGATWAPNADGLSLVFFVAGECETLGINDLNSFDFAYYPNPVKDVLNITTKKNVENVSVFNLAGQKVLGNAKVSNGQINVSTLATGTYVFRVTLEDGQVETFKIIKK